MIQGRLTEFAALVTMYEFGPHAYFDARNLIIEDYVRWGRGAKVLGSAHNGRTNRRSIITTELSIKLVVIGYGADIGSNVTILPRVHVGAHSIVGAGAVVTVDVTEYAVVRGIPAQVIRYHK
jgi:acetyltransferase-like isoleucine patch superfamily enzyme